MDLTIQMRIFINVKCHNIFYFSNHLGLKAKAISCSAVKENLVLFCRKFWAFVVYNVFVNLEIHLSNYEITS